MGYLTEPINKWEKYVLWLFSGIVLVAIVGVIAQGITEGVGWKHKLNTLRYNQDRYLETRKEYLKTLDELLIVRNELEGAVEQCLNIKKEILLIKENRNKFIFINESYQWRIDDF